MSYSCDGTWFNLIWPRCWLKSKIYFCRVVRAGSAASNNVGGQVGKRGSSSQLDKNKSWISTSRDQDIIRKSTATRDKHERQHRFLKHLDFWQNLGGLSLLVLLTNVVFFWRNLTEPDLAKMLVEIQDLFLPGGSRREGCFQQCWWPGWKKRF